MDGVNGKQSMCTRTQLSSSNPVTVIDNAYNENGQITVKLAGQSVNAGKFSFGLKFFQIIIFLMNQVAMRINNHAHRIHQSCRIVNANQLRDFRKYSPV